ncbi:MAG TPA: DUF5103 domain-containing protein [Cytophagaceae bacterium]
MRQLFLLIIIALMIYSQPTFAQKNKKNKPAKEVYQTDKEFVPEDRIYENNIKSVLLYPYTGDPYDILKPAVIPLSQPHRLQLHFDQIGNNIENLYMKIIHCNADWSTSVLNPIQYLEDYNEFNITDRNISLGTRIPYTHYKVIIPKVKVSGNYIIKIYRNYDEDDLLLTRRFIVYEDLVHINAKISYAAIDRMANQQVDFTILYPDLNLVNPFQTVKTVVRQNQRWDNMKFLAPQYVKEEVKTLDYHYFNGENIFRGGNEFRFFDLRSVKFNGQNVGKIIIEDNAEAILLTDKSRKTEAYGLYRDINGKYYPELYETKESEIEPDYVYVTFLLDHPPVTNGKIYVFGALSDWQASPEFEMIYNTEVKKYICTVLLKQGYYNFQYAYVESGKSIPDETYIEGSHNLTENQYEIITYYRPVGVFYDQVIGYKAFRFPDGR